ncbi:MAG: cysteine--tRNA ligase [Acidobacteriia bacterium]|nr:cysteine--tRNA ligase [Terriglobia bacterium]
MLKLTNTMSGQLEEFHPLDDNHVRMYTCGPTVYNFSHIGNFRTYVYEDLLRRWLKFKGCRLTHVMNITDVDDKTLRDSGATEVGALKEFTLKFTQAFFEDCKTLNIERPDLVVNATDHIPEMVSLIQKLVRSGHAYERDGSYYFKISTFPAYGRLAKLDVAGMKLGASVDVDEYEKENVRDFALWKQRKEGELYWDTALGKGRPGWHIECSAMSMRYLGEHFDIHCGAVDNIFPHHENEIAQSECATGQPFVNVWLHGEHLVVNGEKMAKSKGNFFTLRDLTAQGFSPRAIRYTLAAVPYRKPLNFTFESVHQSHSAIERLEEFLLRVETGHFEPGQNEKIEEKARWARRRFVESMDDDLNTAQALGAVFELVHEANVALAGETLKENNRPTIRGLFADFQNIFAVLKDPASQMLEAEIEQLMAERQAARQSRQFKRSDEIRDQLLARGIVLEDTKDGVRWKRKD